MSRTFIAEKRGTVSKAEVRRLRRLWWLAYRGLLPLWVPRLWMRLHGWEARPLIEFRPRHQEVIR